MVRDNVNGRQLVHQATLNLNGSVKPTGRSMSAGLPIDEYAYYLQTGV